jgi:hypothetical protein
VNVYHATVGALYVVVDAVVMELTTCLSTSKQMPGFPAPDNVQVCPRVLKDPDVSGTLRYTPIVLLNVDVYGSKSWW